MLSLRTRPTHAARRSIDTQTVIRDGKERGSQGQGHSQGISQGHTRDGTSEEIDFPSYNCGVAKSKQGLAPSTLHGEGVRGHSNSLCGERQLPRPLPSMTISWRTTRPLMTDLKPGVYQIRVKDRLNHPKGWNTVVNSSIFRPSRQNLNSIRKNTHLGAYLKPAGLHNAGGRQICLKPTSDSPC